MHRPNRRRVLAALVVLLGVSCAGSPTGGNSAAGHGAGDRATTPHPGRWAAAPGEGPAVEIGMVDTAFDPGQVTVPSGAAVTFRFTNRGTIAHEAFVGDAHAQADHAAGMASAAAGGHGGHGGAAEGVRLEPGESATVTHPFDAPGEFEIGCHMPGHYESGMRVVVTVT